MSSQRNIPPEERKFRYHILEKDDGTLFLLDEHPPHRSERTELGKEDTSRPRFRGLSKEPGRDDYFFFIGKEKHSLSEVFEECIDETADHKFPECKAWLFE
ncbi:hypothetical protein RCL1_000641 [Eukaryota sp. TZLM3-RCL]